MNTRDNYLESILRLMLPIIDITGKLDLSNFLSLPKNDKPIPSYQEYTINPRDYSSPVNTRHKIYGSSRRITSS